MANQNSAKGNPASHRMGNPKLKARRAACYIRGEKRKTDRVADNDQRRRTNKASKLEAVTLGQTYLTPVEVARELRAERREPLRKAYAAFSGSYAAWLDSVARRDALAAGEAIRDAQRRRRG